LSKLSTLVKKSQRPGDDRGRVTKCFPRVLRIVSAKGEETVRGACMVRVQLVCRHQKGPRAEILKQGASGRSSPRIGNGDVPVVAPWVRARGRSARRGKDQKGARSTAFEVADKNKPSKKGTYRGYSSCQKERGLEEPRHRG